MLLSDRVGWKLNVEAKVPVAALSAGGMQGWRRAGWRDAGMEGWRDGR